MIRFGMRLFLVSLSVLFIAGVVGYLIIRGQGQISEPAEPIALPSGLWVSTAVLLVSGWTIHRANRQARSNETGSLKLYLGATFVLSVLFVGIQAPSLVALLGIHRAALAEHSFNLYGISFALIGIHAAHVLGGMLPLGRLFARVWRGGVGRHLQPSIHLCAIYWHFLDVVWVALFALLLFTL
jgi:cytochrome c oxidase subunit 3